MTRKNLHIPSGGKVDASYLESLYQDLATNIKIIRLKLQD